jgi:hypothetical protein
VRVHALWLLAPNTLRAALTFWLTKAARPGKSPDDSTLASLAARAGHVFEDDHVRTIRKDGGALTSIKRPRLHRDIENLHYVMIRARPPGLCSRELDIAQVSSARATANPDSSTQ